MSIVAEALFRAIGAAREGRRAASPELVSRTCDLRDDLRSRAAVAFQLSAEVRRAAEVVAGRDPLGQGLALRLGTSAFFRLSGRDVVEPLVQAFAGEAGEGFAADVVQAPSERTEKTPRC